MEDFLSIKSFPQEMFVRVFFPPLYQIVYSTFKLYQVVPELAVKVTIFSSIFYALTKPSFCVAFGTDNTEI